MGREGMKTWEWLIVVFCASTAAWLAGRVMEALARGTL